MTKRYVDSGEVCVEDHTEKRYKLANPNNVFKDMNIGIVEDNTCMLKLVDVVNLLNEQEERINELELENAKHIGDGEWDIRDITYGHGKFRLEEWGERYHQFYDGDKPLEDETVVSLLFENDKLKQQIETKNQQIKKLEKEILTLKITYAKCRDCKHANMYTPEFAFLVIDPKCGLNVKAITSESNACEDFELIGRCSR